MICSVARHAARERAARDRMAVYAGSNRRIIMAFAVIGALGWVASMALWMLRRH